MNDNKLISYRRSEISLFPDSAGNKGRFAQPAGRFPIFGINDNMLVVVWGLARFRGFEGTAKQKSIIINAIPKSRHYNGSVGLSGSAEILGGG